MPMDPQLDINYFKKSLSEGKSREDLFKEYLEKGWTIDKIQLLMSESTKESDKEDSQKRVIRIVVGIGALLIGAGIFSFIAANWQVMSKEVKLLVIVGSMLVIYSLGWFVREVQKLIKTGSALLFLGSVVYGAGIFLVAQIFNVRANWPDGLILWMIGLIIMAFALDIYSFFTFAIVLGLIVVFSNPYYIYGAFSGFDPFLMTSSLLLLAATVITFVSGVIIYKKVPAESN